MTANEFLAKFSRRTRVTFASTVAALLLLLILSIFALPALVRNQLEKEILEQTGRSAAVARVSFNPFGLTLTVEDFRIFEPDKKTVFVGFERLTLSLSTATFFRFAPIIDELLLEKPNLLLIRTAGNRYNFSDIIDRLAKKPQTPKKGETFFSVNNIRVTGGSIDFNDTLPATPVNHTVRSLHFEIPFISNLPYLAEKYTDPMFSAEVDGGKLNFRGKTKPLAKEVEATLDIKLAGLNLPQYQPYVPLNLPFRIESGTLSLNLGLSYKIHKDKKPEFIIKGETHLERLNIKERNGAQIAELKLLETRIASAELITGRYLFEKILIDTFDLHVSRDAKGVLSLQRFFAPHSTAPQVASETKKSDDVSTALFSVTTLSLDNSSVNFHDLLPTGGFKTELSSISATVSNLSTSPDSKADYKISLEGESDEQLVASGSATLTPLAVNSIFELTDVELQRAWPYLQDFLSAPLKGVISVGGKADFNLADGLSLSNGTLRLNKLSARYGDSDAADISAFALTGISFSQKNSHFEAALFSIDKGKVSLTRLENGTFSPLLLLKKRGETAPAKMTPSVAKKGVPPEKPFSYILKELETKDLAIAFKDKKTAGEPSFNVNGIKLKTGNITGPKLSPMPVSFSARYGGNAPISLNGTVTAEPFSYRGTAYFARVPIRDFEDYLHDRVNLFFIDGTLDTSLNLDIKTGSDGKLTGSYSGSGGVRSFHVMDTVLEEDLLKWESLQMDSIAGKLEPFALSIGDIAVNSVYARIAVRKDRSLNLQNLAVKPAVPEAKPEEKGVSDKTAPVKTATSAESTADGKPKPEETSAAERIKISSVTIQDGTIVFSDSHLPEQFRTTFYNLGGRVSGLSSNLNSRAEVDLRGSLENQSPLQIVGQINPLREDLFVDLTVKFKDIELAPATPYSGTYLGYTIDRGKLFLDLKYQIENRNLIATNKVFVDQFEFGDSVQSDKATTLPVRLGVALLKDRKGEIHLDLPITGRTDDPQFSIWRLVWKMVANVFVKAVTSPFSLLASMIGSSEDLSSVTFGPGVATLDPAEEKKLATLAKALADRPGLKVEISGYADRGRDPEGFRSAQLQRKIQQEKYLEMVKKKLPTAGLAAEKLVIAPEEASRLLKAVYQKETFPKPRNAIGMLKSLPDSEMRKLILTNTAAGEPEMKQLAEQRAVAVQQYLATSGKLDSKRLFQKRDNIYKTPKNEKGSISRVELNPVPQ